MQFGIQYPGQRGVGDARLGNFSTWNIGGGARVLWKGLRVGTALHCTSDDAPIRTPDGTWPGYLSLMVTECDRAGEKAYGVVQNHLVQVMALLAMEAPIGGDVDALRDEKVKVLRGTRPLDETARPPRTSTSRARGARPTGTGSSLETTAGTALR